MAENAKNDRYGWVICGVCTLLIFVTMGTASNALSVFMPYIMKGYDLTNSQTSFLVTLRCAFAFISMLMVGRFYDRLGYRAGTGIASLLCCTAYLIYSFSSGYLQICVGASMAGISYGLGSMIPVAILINRWFVRHKALAVGICSAGSGVAVIVLPTIITSFILNYSLKTAFLFTAAFVFVSSMIILLLIRDDPADMGMHPVGYKNPDQTGSKEEPASDRDVSENMPHRTMTRTQWILTAAVCLTMGAMANPGFVHLSVLYTSEGFTPMTVAILISICGFVLTGGKILCGEAADILGGFRATMLFFGIMAAGNAMCCMAFTGNNILAVTAVVLFGVGSPICTVGIPVWANELDCRERYADNVRHMQLIYAAGAMLFASMPGIIADALGSYIPYYFLFAVMTGISAVCMTIVYRHSR